MIRRKHILLLLEWYDYRIHRGVAQVAREAGWQLNCPKKPISNIGYIKNWQGDGCIVLLQCTKTLDYFQTHSIPLVDLGLEKHNLPIPRVVTDNCEIGRLAADHFRNQGYQEVFTLSPGGKQMFRERLNALQKSMSENSGVVTVLHSSDSMSPQVLLELSNIARQRHRSLEEMSLAFFAYEDNMAAELLSLCLQHELRVPENIAILGVDNDDLINAGLTVNLSSIDSDQEGLGRKAALLLREMLDHPEHQYKKCVLRHSPKDVVIRQSTDCYALQNPLVSNALHWIQNNYHTHIQAIDVANAMNVSQQGLQKAFAEWYIRSPGQEIRYQRIQAAAHLLSSTRYKLDKIAHHCGFYSADTLINCFRRTFGMTPGKYRKQYSV